MSDEAAARTGTKRVRRRTGEVRGLILGAARAVFAERGFAGATTRLIATRAGVAEPLIFGNFGTKAALFTEAVIAPFNARLEAFIDMSDALPRDRAERNALFVHSIYRFLRDNADLLHAMLKSSNDVDAPFRHGLDAYFARGVGRMRSQYEKMGLRFDVPPELIVRYSFGMLAGAVLFGDWLFPGAAAPDDEAEHALARMIFKASEPAPP